MSRIFGATTSLRGLLAVASARLVVGACGKVNDVAVAALDASESSGPAGGVPNSATGAVIDRRPAVGAELGLRVPRHPLDGE
jgi:hypothetical protein